MKNIKIFILLFPMMITYLSFAQQAGDLDYSFGSMGISITDNNSYDDIAGSSVVTPWNGKIVIAGTSIDGIFRYMSILRLGVLGTPDVSFSDDGWQTMQMSGYNETGSTVLLQITKPVLTGYNEDNYFPKNFVMYRFLGGDGSLDDIFGENGIVETDFSNNNPMDGAYAGVVMGHKIILAGETDENGSNSMFALARYNLGGDMDFSFGNSGLVTTDFETYPSKDIIWALALEQEGKIIAVGESDYRGAMARYEQDGTLDNSFGAGGKVIAAWSSHLDEVVTLPDGKFLVAGKASITIAIARYNNNGTLDSTFGTNGKTELQGVNPSIIVYGNKIYIATSLQSSNFDFDIVLTRLDHNGQIDNTFGNGGSVLTAISTYDDIARDIHIQPGGRIIVTGETGIPSDIIAVGYHNEPLMPNVPFYIVDGIWNQGFIKLTNPGSPAVTGVEAFIYTDSIPGPQLKNIFITSGAASRFYEIAVTPENSGSNSPFNATIRLYYTADDIQGIDENKLKLYRVTNDGWTYIGGNVNVNENYVEADNISEAGIFAFVDPDLLSNEDIDQEGAVIQFALLQNQPNPFNPATTIQYSIPQTEFASLKIFDILGNEIITLVNEEKPAGNYKVTWYAAKLPSGVYFYQLRAGDFVKTKKMILLR